MGLGSGASGRLTSHVGRFLAEKVPAGSRLCVALSGGMDSVVLLDLCLGAARNAKIEVSALHVDHGISANAVEWAEFCANLCRRAEIRLTIEKARLDPSAPGLEAKARAARREAYARCGAEFVALGHHLDDQAETFLFRAMRGGAAGLLGCMDPVSRLAAGSPVVLLRPLLGHARAELRAHAELRKLEWREDESNRDDRFSRNFIRNRALPLLEGHFPGYRAALGAQAAELGDIRGLLEEIARLDHRLAIAGDGWAREHFRQVGERRTRNWLLHLPRFAGGAPCGWRRIREAARQIRLPPGHARQLELDFGGLRMVAHGDSLYLIDSATARGRFAPVELRFAEGIRYENLLGELTFDRDDRRGIGARLLQGSKLELRPRLGGEKMADGGGRPRRQLKELLREAGVPPWERASAPLVYVDGTLAAVPNVRVGVCHRAHGEAGYFPRWISRVTIPADSVPLAPPK